MAEVVKLLRALVKDPLAKMFAAGLAFLAGGAASSTLLYAGAIAQIQSLQAEKAPIAQVSKLESRVAVSEALIEAERRQRDIQHQEVMAALGRIQDTVERKADKP